MTQNHLPPTRPNEWVADRIALFKRLLAQAQVNK